MPNLCANEKRTSGNDLANLHNIAEEEGIPVDFFQLRKREALSIMDTDGSCAIAIDPQQLAGDMDEKIKLAHELGHCMTGAFYNIYSPLDIRAKHEVRANRWAYQRLVSVEELARAFHRGVTEPWELAEYFSVPEDFLREAVAYYMMLAEQDAAEKVQ